MDFDKIRRCSCGGTMELVKCPVDPELHKELADIYYCTPGVVYEHLYHIICRNGTRSTGSFGRTLEEAVEKWNNGRTCQDMWADEGLKE